MTRRAAVGPVAAGDGRNAVVPTTGPQPDADIERRDDGVVRISGEVGATTGCAAVAYGGTTGSPREATVVLTPVRDGLLCSDRMTAVAYDLVLAFADRVPDELSVRVAEPTRRGPVARRVAVEPSDADAPSRTVRRQPNRNRLSLTGTVEVPTGRTGVEYAGTEVRDERAVVTLATVGDDCVPAHLVDYRLLLEFPRGLPDAVEVRTSDA